jgi:hypothetical protein
LLGIPSEGYFFMTFGEYFARLQRSVSRTDIGDDEYRDMAQRALKKIQQRRSWGCMKTSTQLTMPQGAISIPLPDDFKELQSGDAPVRNFYTNAGYSRPLPCDVKTKREFERLYAKFSYGALSSYYFRYNVIRLPVYLDQSGGVWTLNIAFQANSPIIFEVDYYGFLPMPQDEADTNFFLSNYEEMVMAKAKAICWESVNDDLSQEFEALFSKELKECAHDDAYRQTRGVEMRM